MNSFKLLKMKKYKFDSNTANLILTFVLVFFSTFYVWGLINIFELKSNLKDEISKLAVRIERLNMKDTLLIKQTEDIRRVTTKLDYLYRIDVNHSLELIDSALIYDPKNTYLILQKAYLLSHRLDYLEAKRCYEIVLSIDPTNQGAITSLCELILLEENIGDYDELYRRYRHFIHMNRNGAFAKYLDILKSYILGSQLKIK